MVGRTIWKVCTIVDEERGDMVSDEVLVATLAIDLGREAMRVSSYLATAIARNNDRKPGKDLADSAGLQPTRGGHVTPVSERLKCPIGAVT